MSTKGRHHPVWTLSAALSLIALGPGLMALEVPGVGVWLVVYGAENGIYSIAWGTVPLALFGPDRHAGLVGRLARPGLIAQVLALPFGALVVTQGGADALFVLLTIFTLGNLGVIAALWSASHPDLRYSK